MDIDRPSRRNSHRLSGRSRKSGILRAQMEMQQAHDLELLQSEQQRTSRQTEEITALQQSLAVARTEKKALEERLDNQKAEIESMHKQLNLEFENIANKIFQQKTETFSQLSTERLNMLLKPFDENLKEFRHQVAEVYDKESKTAFLSGRQDQGTRAAEPAHQ